MHQATVTIDPTLTVGDVDPRLFGSFVEHMGRCVYTGIYEPEHDTADDEGFRGDVAELVSALDVPIIRYPGGNFVSGYNWEDGIGPRAERPVRLDLAWRSVETNQVGIHEFAGWADRVGSEVMLAVNLGSRGPDEARRLVEYCNHPGGTELSDLRRKNGAVDPFGVKVWCLGNELDGPWQIGHKTAYEYGRIARETGKVMRWVDPSIELVAVGSSNRRMPTFGEWESTVLEECYDVVDHLSLHSYYEERKGDRDSFLAAAVELDRFIGEAVATCDYVRAKGRHKKQITLSVDEWNVWYQSRFAQIQGDLDWATAPRLIEDTYSVVDAVVVGDLLITLLKHADRVKIGCLAQLVNVIAPIRSEPHGPSWRQSTFHPFALTSAHGRGTVLHTVPRSPSHETKWMGEVPLLDLVAVHHGDLDTVTVFAVNRAQTEPMTVELDVRALSGGDTVAEHTAVFDDDPDAVNTADAPDRVTPHQLDTVASDGGRLRVELPPLSWNMLTLRKP